MDECGEPKVAWIADGTEGDPLTLLPQTELSVIPDQETRQISTERW
jgi:hypothetical protein